MKSFEIKDGRLYHKGNLDLKYRGTVHLPDNLIIEGDLYLQGVENTSLPNNLVVGGSLDLARSKIASLPDNFTVGGSLDLRGTDVTSLPNNLTVRRNLYLRGTKVTSLPNNLIVGGTVYWDNINAGNHTAGNLPELLQWRGYKYVEIDGIFFEVVSREGNVFKIKQIGRAQEIYLITDGNGKWSYGETLDEAKSDLIYRISNWDKSKYNGFVLESELTFEEAIGCYRVITGACADGTKMFVEDSLKTRKEMYTVAEIIKITEGWYRNEEFKRFFDR